MDGSYNNPYKFNSKELDEDTRLYYYGARYYNPRLSIWYGVDPLGEKMPSWSPYNYTFDNPVNLTDLDGLAPSPPIRWRNLNVQIQWTANIDYVSFEHATARIQEGIMTANDGKTKMSVSHVTTVKSPDNNGNYKWSLITDLSPEEAILYKTNCFGLALTGGLYFINATNKDIINYLKADGYKNLGTPKSSTNFKVGDLLLWEGHIIEAIKKDKNGLVWQSKYGQGGIVEGSLNEILQSNVNSSGEDVMGDLSKSTLFRAGSNATDVIYKNDRKTKEGNVKKVINEDNKSKGTPAGKYNW